MNNKFTLILIIFLLFAGLVNVSHAQQVQIPKIVIYAPDELTGLKKHIEEHFVDMYNAVNTKLMLNYTKTINCVIVPSLSELENELTTRFGQQVTLKDSIAGVAVKSQSLIVLNSRAYGNQPFIGARQTFRHELAHLMLGSIESKGELPYWFEEGLCQWAEQLLFYPTFSDRALYGSLEGAPTIGKIESMMERRNNLNYAYVAAFNAVEFLLRQKSLSRLPEFYFNFSANGNFDKSFQQSFSETVLEFEARWHTNIAPNTPVRILNFMGANWFTLLFGVGGILLIVAYIFKRKRLKPIIKAYENEDALEDKEYDESHTWMREAEKRRKIKGLPEPEDDDDDDFDPEL